MVTLNKVLCWKAKIEMTNKAAGQIEENRRNTPEQPYSVSSD